MDMAVDQLDGEADRAAERIGVLEDKVAELEAGYTELLALGQEQVETSTQAAQQAKIRFMEGRMDVMREMILGLEHMAANPIVVDKETVVTESESGEELEVEENEVAIPVLVPGRLVPIEDEIQVLSNELVGTQIAFELADKDRPPSYE